MTAEINSNNLFLLLPGKVSQVARIYAEKQGVAILDALRQFYHSETYHNLETESTKYWHYGPVALYEDFSERN